MDLDDDDYDDEVMRPTLRCLPSFVVLLHDLALDQEPSFVFLCPLLSLISVRMHAMPVHMMCCCCC